MTNLVNSTVDNHLVRKKSIEAAKRLLNTQAASLLLLDEKTGELFFEVAVGEKGSLLQSVRLPRGRGIAGWVAEHGMPVVVHDVGNDPRFYPGVDEISGFITRDMICVPVTAKDRALGALQAINNQGEPFEEDDMLILHALANQVAVAIENARLHQESITDGLTGLYHHNYFVQRLEEEIDRASRYQHPLTLAMLDIDHFKEVNDRHGHLAGDRVLERCAAAIKENTRLSDIAGRYGGEEFGIVLPYTFYGDGLKIGDRFRKAAAAPGIPDIPITISVGLAFWAGGSRNCSAARLIEMADKAMYAAKRNGRNRVEALIVE